MKKEELYRFVDHTALKAVTTWKEIQQLCQEARFFRMASVCIPSSYVKRAHEYFPELNICTVVGFPLGNANTEAKLMETRQALADGASEIDMVINLGMVKNGQYPQVTEEIRLLKQEVGDKILKVIIETCYLTEEEKIEYASCCYCSWSGFYQDIYWIWNRRSNFGRCLSDERAYRTECKDQSCRRYSFKRRYGAIYRGRMQQDWYKQCNFHAAGRRIRWICQN